MLPLAADEDVDGNVIRGLPCRVPGIDDLEVVALCGDAADFQDRVWYLPL